MSNNNFTYKVYNAVSAIGGAMITNGSDLLQNYYIHNHLKMPIWLQSGGDFFNPIALTGMLNLLNGNGTFINPRYTPLLATFLYETYEVTSKFIPQGGTFDPKDMVAYALGGLVAYVGTKLSLKENPLEPIKKLFSQKNKSFDSLVDQ